MIGTRRRSPLRAVTYGNERYRIGAWRGAADVGYIAPVTPVSPVGILRACNDLAGEGFGRAITAALNPAEQRAFLGNGFEVHERLHLLRHTLSRIGPKTDAAALIRRGKRRDRADVLRIDHDAFEPFWRLDDHGLDEAINATPVSRFRVLSDGPILGYSVSGRAGTVGYLQRLAVDPQTHGRGLGTELVNEVLRWSRRHRCSSVLVNTQERNAGALRLYEHLGFTRVPEGLAVLERALA